MAAALVQALFTGASKTKGTSLVISGSKTITAGNLLMVGFACDDVGTAFGCVDNLGNTYTLQTTIALTGSVKTMIFTAPVTSAGTLTSQTISWTTDATAKAAQSAEYSGLGAQRLTDGLGAASSNNTYYTANRVYAAGEMSLLAAGYEDNQDQAGLAFSPGSYGDGTAKTGSGALGVHGVIAGTTGGGSASNICCAIGWVMPTVDTGSTGLTNSNGLASEPNAAAQVLYNVAVAADRLASLVAPRTASQAVKRASSWFRRQDGLLVPRVA